MKIIYFKNLNCLMKTRLSIIILLNIFTFLGAQTKSEILEITSNYNSELLTKIKSDFEEKNLINEILINKYLAENPEVKRKYYNPDGTVYEINYIRRNKPIYISTNNQSSATATRTNFINSGGDLGLTLDGQNMTIGMWEIDVVRPTHRELQNNSPDPISRVTSPDSNSQNEDGEGHATHVAGTMIAKGVTPTARGMAPEANLVSYDTQNLESEIIYEAGTNGLLISNHSWGYPIFVPQGSNEIQQFDANEIGTYTNRSRTRDLIAYNAPYFLEVVSAGNEGAKEYDGGLANNYDKLTGNKVSKNNLVVANASNPLIHPNGSGELLSISIHYSSSQGPADDGRVKPDISGDGVNLYSSSSASDASYSSKTGTSMAAPNVAGTLLLLQQYYNELNGNFMKASTLKGLACHTADDASPTGPDAVYGWGLLNAKAAAETILENQDNTARIFEGTLNQGETYSYTFSTATDGKLKATLCWTDPPGIASQALNDPNPDIINDLDMRINKEGSTYYPWKLSLENVAAWATRDGDNNVDNVEKIEVDNSLSGTYTLSITHKGTLTDGAQNFSLILTGLGMTLNTNNLSKDTFKVWPNPAKETINYQFASSTNQTCLVQLIDLQGRIVYSQNVLEGSASIQGTINTSSCSKGVYFLSLNQGNQKTYKKVMLQ